MLMMREPGRHERRPFTGHVEQAFDIGVDHSVPIVVDALVDGLAPHGQTGVVDENRWDEVGAAPLNGFGRSFSVAHIKTQHVLHRVTQFSLQGL